MAQSQNQYQPDKHKHAFQARNPKGHDWKMRKYKPFQQGHKQQLMVVKQDS